MYICLMELQTIVNLEKPPFRLDYQSLIMMVGSCFVENVGEKLEYFRFHTDVNPCGIVYNPVSAAQTLRLLMERRQFVAEDLWHHGGLWGSFLHHGRFSDADCGACLEKINKRIQLSSEHLKHTDLLVITWGTSWVYEYLQTGQVVSNCHKFPAADFRRYRLKVEEIVDIYRELIQRLKAYNPSLNILFTVSPIRHWKDGAHGNQLSKAVLHLAIDELVNTFDFVDYFPSYEIVMDELRDYRFYTSDMLHVSPQGVDYIWEKFCSVYFDAPTLEVMHKVDKLNRTLKHRPSDPGSVASIQLRLRTLEELKKLLGYDIVIE